MLASSVVPTGIDRMFLLSETQLPDRLAIGPYSYALVIPNALEQAADAVYGSCCHTEQVIKVQNHYPCVGQAIDTLMHELLHALFRAFRVPEGEDDETTVDVLGVAFASFLTSNPEFLIWLTEVTGTLPPQFIVPESLVDLMSTGARFTPVSG